MKVCIHIQTHEPHFKYTDLLIKSFLEFTNISELEIPIFIIFDNDHEIEKYKKTYKYDYKEVNYIDVSNTINNVELKFTEKSNELFKHKINIQWGSGGHRNYVAVKRIYSILELEKRGYSHVWCMDSESLVLKELDIQKIIEHNLNKPLLTIGKYQYGIKYPQIINDIFKLNYEDFKNISVRMNDFWFIHTNYFSEMINFLFEIHKNPISYFINGSEQSIYEYYIYYKYIKDNNSVNLIEIEGDLHENNLFKQIIYNDKLNLDYLCEKLNNIYFDYVQSYRGDYYKMTLGSQRGKELIRKLNISIAVSNYTGM